MQTVRGKSTHATNIVRHKMTHTGEKRHQCKLCGKCLSTPGNAYRHIRNVHKKNPKLANLGKGFSGINFKHWDQGQRRGKVKKERYGASTNHDSQRKGTRRTKQSFVCGQCGKLCRDSYDLKLQCTLCNKCFSSRYRLVRRTMTHAGEKRFDCVLCHKWFPSKSELERHNRTHTGEKPFKCQHCDKCFSVESNRRRHEKIHSDGMPLINNPKPFKFKHCGKRFSDSPSRRRHEKTHSEGLNNSKHNIDVNGADGQQQKMRRQKRSIVKGDFSTTQGFACKHCRKRFPNQFRLTRHTRTHTGEKPFACERCGKLFSDSANLRRHEKTHGEKISVKSNSHDNMRVSGAGKQVEKMRRGKGKVPENRSKKRRFQCGHCGKCFPSPFNLERHTRTHTGEKPFACERCGKLFSDSGNMRRHEKAHGEKISVKSNSHDNMRVSRAGKQEEKMRRGKRKVPENLSKKRRFQCGHCGKRFLLPYDLKRHTRTHTGEKPFKCEQCGKRFNRLGSLRRHEKTHKVGSPKNDQHNTWVERLFQCEHCGKRFSSKCHLNRHNRTHTGEKPFKCQDCDKWFSTSGNRKRHEQIHSAGMLVEKQEPRRSRHACWICAEEFRSELILRKHYDEHMSELCDVEQ